MYKKNLFTILARPLFTRVIILMLLIVLRAARGALVDSRRAAVDTFHRTGVLDTASNVQFGEGGAGTFSDGKLSLSYEVGGDLPDLIGEELAQGLIDYTDGIYLEFGAAPEVEGITENEEIKEIRHNAIKAGLKLVDCPIRHLGTEKAQELYYAIQTYLQQHGVEILFETECEDILLEGDVCKGVCLRSKEGTCEVRGEEIIIATGSETITLKHEAENRSLFAQGALAAAAFIAGKAPGMYDMRSIIE